MGLNNSAAIGTIVSAICSVFSTVWLVVAAAKNAAKNKENPPMNANAPAAGTGIVAAVKRWLPMAGVGWVTHVVALVGILSAVYLSVQVVRIWRGDAGPASPPPVVTLIACPNTNYEAAFTSNSLDLRALENLVDVSYASKDYAYTKKFYEAYRHATPDPDARNQEPLYQGALLALNPTIDGYAIFHTNIDLMYSKITNGEWNHGYSPLGFIIQNLGKVSFEYLVN